MPRNPLHKLKSLVIIDLITGLSYAAEPSNDALIDLAAAPRFAFGGIGFAGLTSDGETAYQTIMSRPSALAEFETLFLVGNPQGKAYALVGIRALNPARYRDLAQPLRGSRERVLTQQGCLVQIESLGAILDHIDGNRYIGRARLPSPSTTAAR